MRQYQSRLSKVENEKNVKSAYIYGGLTILIIIIAFIFVIKLFPKFINLVNPTKSSDTSQNQVMLLTPTLQIPPEFTNQSSIIIKGSTSENAKVKIFFNDSSDETTSDDTGSFALNIGLKKGKNSVYAKTIDDSGNSSNSSTTYIINYKTDQPNLTVTTPQNNSSFYTNDQKNINVEGTTDQGNTVTVNDHVAIVEDDGKFSLSVGLQNGDNQIKVVSTDQAGNKKEIDLKVTFNP